MHLKQISITFTALSLVAVAAYAQDSHDCRRPPSDRALPLSGRWRDDGNGKLVDISGNVKATYVEANQCKFPDSAGDAVPLPVDFEGTASSGHHIDASMYYCIFAKDGGETHTISTSSREFSGDMNLDGQFITGTFSSPDGPQTVHLTRVSKLNHPDPPSSDSDQKGFVFVTPANGRSESIYQQPSAGSTVVGSPPNGGRYLFTQVAFEAGIPVWYRIQPPGGIPGWLPAASVSCARPPPSNKKPLRMIDSRRDALIGAYSSGGARG